MYQEFDSVKNLIEVKMIEQINTLQGAEDYLVNRGILSRYKAAALVRNMVNVTQQNDLKMIAQLLSSRK